MNSRLRYRLAYLGTMGGFLVLMIVLSMGRVNTPTAFARLVAKRLSYMLPGTTASLRGADVIHLDGAAGLLSASLVKDWRAYERGEHIDPTGVAEGIAQKYRARQERLTDFLALTTEEQLKRVIILPVPAASLGLALDERLIADAFAVRNINGLPAYLHTQGADSEWWPLPSIQRIRLGATIDEAQWKALWDAAVEEASAPRGSPATVPEGTFDGFFEPAPANFPFPWFRAVPPAGDKRPVARLLFNSTINWLWRAYDEHSSYRPPVTHLILAGPDSVWWTIDDPGVLSEEAMKVVRPFVLPAWPVCVIVKVENGKFSALRYWVW